MSVLRHKKALKEILEANMVSGMPLYQKCDKVLLSSIRPLPRTEEIYTFIVLGDFIIDDAEVGELKDKYVEISQEIICGAVVQDAATGEADAEFDSYTLARLVRTIIKDNLTLSCSSYPDGICKRTALSNTPLEFVEFYDTPCAISAVNIFIYMQEED